MEQDMKYIYQVYQDGSFSAAAEHLYMSQPALSIAVKRVEESVGAELFDRSRRPLALTEAGQNYIDTLQGILRLEEDLARQIEDLRGLKTGTLRLGGTHFLNCYILAPILAAFAKEYPGIRIELSEDRSLAKTALSIFRRSFKNGIWISFSAVIRKSSHSSNTDRPS